MERLCRYIARPAVSEKRLSLLDDGRIRYARKTPYRDGTTHVIFERLDFLARLAALVPTPRGNHNGVFSPNSKHRIQVTPAVRAHRLQEYINGFVYRFNRRCWEGQIPNRLLALCVGANGPAVCGTGV